MHGQQNIKKITKIKCQINLFHESDYWYEPHYRGAGKSLAQPGRKQANVSVRMA